MSVTIQSFFMPLIRVCLFFGVFFGSIYAVMHLINWYSAGHRKALPIPAATSFVLPLLILFAWDRVLS